MALMASDATETDIADVGAAFAGVELSEWLTAAAFFVISIVVAGALRHWLRKLAEERSSPSLRAAATVLSYVVGILGLIYSLGALGIAITPLLGAFGLAGFALAFAMQDIIENFLAGLLIQFRRPFRHGDEVESDDFAGVVQDIDARTVTVLTPEGEIVKLPSADVMKNAIVNHSTIGRRRTTVDVSLAYDTDLDSAVEILRNAALVEGVHRDPPPRAMVHTFGASGIDIAVRFWHGPTIADRWEVRDRVARSIHRAVKEHGLEIPFPQRVLQFADAPPSEFQDTSASGSTQVPKTSR